MERPRKAPAVERGVAEITEDDILVRVIGTVKESSDAGFVLQDENGSIKVDAQENMKKGERVRVFARPTKIGKELVLSSELIQDISKLDENIYKKIKTQGL
ncbi:MAG: hypothetical protein ABIF92_00245 [archaeon]